MSRNNEHAGIHISDIFQPRKRLEKAVRKAGPGSKLVATLLPPEFTIDYGERAHHLEEVNYTLEIALVDPTGKRTKGLKLRLDPVATNSWLGPTQIDKAVTDSLRQRVYLTAYDQLRQLQGLTDPTVQDRLLIEIRKPAEDGFPEESLSSEEMAETITQYKFLKLGPILGATPKVTLLPLKGEAVEA